MSCGALCLCYRWEKLVKLSDFVFEDGSGLEGRDVVSRNKQSSVLADITGGFLSTLLDDEAAEATEIYILTVGETILHHGHKLFDYCDNHSLVNAGCSCDFACDFCLCHFCLSFTDYLLAIRMRRLTRRISTFERKVTKNSALHKYKSRNIIKTHVKNYPLSIKNPQTSDFIGKFLRVNCSNRGSPMATESYGGRTPFKSDPFSRLPIQKGEHIPLRHLLGETFTTS